MTLVQKRSSDLLALLTQVSHKQKLLRRQDFVVMSLGKKGRSLSAGTIVAHAWAATSPFDRCNEISERPALSSIHAMSIC